MTDEQKHAIEGIEFYIQYPQMLNQSRREAVVAALKDARNMLCNLATRCKIVEEAYKRNAKVFDNLMQDYEKLLIERDALKAKENEEGK